MRRTTGYNSVLPQLAVTCKIEAEYCLQNICAGWQRSAPKSPTSATRKPFDKIRWAHLVERVRAKRGSLREPSSNKG